jgi:hypothetical protein
VYFYCCSWFVQLYTHLDTRSASDFRCVHPPPTHTGAAAHFLTQVLPVSPAAWPVAVRDGGGDLARGGSGVDEGLGVAEGAWPVFSTWLRGVYSAFISPSSFLPKAAGERLWRQLQRTLYKDHRSLYEEYGRMEGEGRRRERKGGSLCNGKTDAGGL